VCLSGLHSDVRKYYENLSFSLSLSLSLERERERETERERERDGERDRDGALKKFDVNNKFVKIEL
jgi:hypothetical protein